MKRTSWAVDHPIRNQMIQRYFEFHSLLLAVTSGLDTNIIFIKDFCTFLAGGIGSGTEELCGKE